MTTLSKITDIAYFVSHNENHRCLNDFTNKIRENIINSMPYIDTTYFTNIEYGSSWTALKNNFDAKINLLCPTYHSYKIEYKAGRKYNYDFIISFIDKHNTIITNEKLEFKYNASSISETPQFVSPMKPSQYLSHSFEEYYYDNYLITLLQQFSLLIPERSLYLSSIHTNKPKCMEHAQILYYQGCPQSSKYTNEPQAIQFYKECNKASKECIKQFIAITDLDISKLNDYLIASQNNKKYLLYKNGEFNIQSTDNDDYTIVNYIKNPIKSRYEATTKNNKKINILLRWKNGNGVAFPAFQIS